MRSDHAKAILRPVCNQLGVNIFAIMMVSIIGIFATAPLLTKLSMQKKILNKNNIKLSARIVQRNFQTRLGHPVVWVKTLNDDSNATLDCFREKTSCKEYSQSESPIKYVRGLKGDLYLNLNEQSAGLSFTGKPCEGFSDSKPNQDCPFRPHITWQPVCEDEDCNAYKVRVNVRLALSKAFRQSINFSTLDFSVSK